MLVEVSTGVEAAKTEETAELWVWLWLVYTGNAEATTTEETAELWAWLWLWLV